jgi:hypothetical protein
MGPLVTLKDKRSSLFCWSICGEEKLYKCYNRF